MSSLINISWFNRHIQEYLPARLSQHQLSLLSELGETSFQEIISDLDAATTTYNEFPNCLPDERFPPQIFHNTTHLKSLVITIPRYSTILSSLADNHSDLNTALGEMASSTYFHYIYLIVNPLHLLANLMTLVYRCHLLSVQPELRRGQAQISSTLEEMSALRYLLGTDNLHFQSTMHWIKDWEGEGFSPKLASLIQE